MGNRLHPDTDDWWKVVLWGQYSAASSEAPSRLAPRSLGSASIVVNVLIASP
jgi:hypothetical protein